MQVIRRTLGPLFFMTVCPALSILLWYTATHLDGSFFLLYKIIIKHGFFTTLYDIWSPVFFGSPTAWIAIFSFIAFEFLLLKYVPGRTITGPETVNKYTPVYKDNGLACFIITVCTYIFLSCGIQAFPLSFIYDHFGELIGALSLLALLFVAGLYIKGRLTPSGPDFSVSGNFIWDFYWGIELYPYMFGVPIKQFTNCRFGMMSWPLIILSFGAAQSQIFGLTNSMIVSIALQLIYITKFFCWESGYLKSLDIMHDRAGFYICWGVLVWVPAAYTSPTLYMVQHPVHLPLYLALSIFILGAFSIITNYLADRQRSLFREKDGNLVVWGTQPIYTKASYLAHDGEQKENLLLASGYWGLARHFHYIPEIMGAFLWSLPALFIHFYPYFYVVFLTLLLFDRAHRDDIRCRTKYGDSWREHCEKVPYKIIPYIY